MSQMPSGVELSEEQLRSTARDVLSQAHYQTGDVPEPPEGFAFFLRVLGQWLMKALRWLFDMTAGLPEFLRWVIVIGLVLVLVALFLHMAWTLFQAMTGGRQSRHGVVLSLDEADVQLSVSELERAADLAVQQGELIEAVRFLFRASLVRLADREKKRLRRGTTDRQYLRHFRGTSVASPLHVFVTTLELKWYGDSPCESQDYDDCREAYRQISSLLPGGSLADTA